MPRRKLFRRERRSEKVMTTLTPDELAVAKARAKAHGLTLSSWLRDLALRDAPPPAERNR